MEKGVACEAKDGGGYQVKESFDEDFNTAVEVIAKRFDKKNFSYLSVAKVNGYTIRVNVPNTVDDADSLFEQMGYMGEFTLRASEDIRNGPLLGAGSRPISDYFKSASSGSSGSTGYVILKMTSDGQDRVAELTEVLKDDDTDATLYFYVGDQQVIGLGLTETIDQRTLYISGSFTPETAENVGIVINSCIKGDNIDLTLNVQSVNEFTVGGSESMMTAVFIVFAAAIFLMAVYSVIRYRGLGVVHIFGFLSFMICMLMFIAFLDGMILTASGIAALALTSILTVLSNYYVFENVRKEFAVGKTLESAIKDGYKRSLAGLLDTHILLFILGLVLYFVGVGEMVPFAYIFTLGVLMSGIVSLVLTRFYWFCMRGLVHRSVQYKFCGFKREVIDDDED
jgi:preprotein translocase subunit SecD